MLDKEAILSETLQKNVFSTRIDKDNAYIFTLSDLHVGASSLPYLKSLIEFISNIDNAYVIVSGDLLNNTTKNSVGSVLEEYASGTEQVKLAVELLTPIKSKIVAIVGSGNHERRSQLDCYITLTEMVATLLGIPEKYTYEFAIGYINCKDVCYIYTDIHKHNRALDYYDYFNADILITEHTHQLNFHEKVVINHNKYTKKPAFKTVYRIENGSALAYPSYSKIGGMKPLPIGMYVVEVSGKKHDIKIWKDSDLYNALERGYK